MDLSSDLRLKNDTKNYAPGGTYKADDTMFKAIAVGELKEDDVWSIDQATSGHSCTEDGTQ